MTEENQTVADQIDLDLRQAMRDRDDVAKIALRSVKTALTEAAKSGDQQKQNENTVLSVIQRESKKRRDAAAEYERLGANERAATERSELAVLERYLPRQLTEDEIAAVVRVAIDETGASTAQDMGRVMAVAMPQVKGLADGKVVSQIVRAQLGG